MSSFRNKKYFQIALYVFLTACSIILLTLMVLHLEAVGAFFKKIFGVFSPFVYGFIIAYLVNPIMKGFENHVLRFSEDSKYGRKLRRPLGVVLGMIVFLLILAVLVGLIIPQVIASFKDLQAKITEYVAAAQKWADTLIREFPLFNGQYESLSEFLDVNEISTDLQSVIAGFSNYLGSAADYILSYGTKFVVEVKNILIGFIAAMYMLFAKERMTAKVKKFFAAVLNHRHYVNLIHLCRFTDRTVGGFIYGKIIDSIIIGILTFIIMSIVKMPFPLLISVIIGITNVIPFFGPFIGAVPAAFIVFIANPIMTIWFLLMILGIQLFDGYVLGPRILGESTGLTSFAVLVSITIAGGLFGFAGMLLGVPAAAVLCVLVRQRTDAVLHAKKASENAEDYLHHLPERDYDNEPIFLDKNEPVPAEYALPPASAAGGKTKSE